MSSRTLGIANLQISSELLKEVFDFNGSTTKMLQPWCTPAFLLGVLTPQDKLLWSPWDLHKLCACKTLMDTVTIALVWCPKNLEGGNKSIKMWLIQMKSASGVKYSLLYFVCHYLSRPVTQPCKTFSFITVLTHESSHSAAMDIYLCLLSSFWNSPAR